MKSRYEAYLRLDVDYLLATWHPTTRPTQLALDPSVHWIRLDILGATGGGFFDSTGTVEFISHYRGGQLHENSRFVTVGRQWLYVDGDVD